MIKKRAIFILTSMAFLCLSLFAFSLFIPKSVNVLGAQYLATDFKMLDEASIKTDADRNGIRFMTFIGNDSEQIKEEYWDTHEMGTLFIPKMAMNEGDELKVDGKYSGVSPVVSKFNGKLDNLVQSDDQPSGKIFNAVLDLSSYNTNANALNNKIVARTYIKDTQTDKITYLDAVEVSPALSAGLMIESGNTDQILIQYVDKVEFVGVNDVNVVGTETIALEVNTNVEGFPFTCEADSGVLTGTQFVPVENEVSTITVTLIGSKKSTSFKVFTINSSSIERQYYAEKDVRQVMGNSASKSRNSSTDYFVVIALNIQGVALNGENLPKHWYFISSDKDGKCQLSINKARLLSKAKSSNELTIKCTNGDVKLKLDIDYADAQELPSSLNYSDSDKKFNITSYASVSDAGGSGDTNSWNDFYKEEYIAEYYDCGMQLLQGGSAAGLSHTYNQVKAGSDLQVVLQTAHNLGKDNSVIVTDNYFFHNDFFKNIVNMNYSGLTDEEVLDGTRVPSFIGRGQGQYATQKAFDNFVLGRVKILKDYPGFGGYLLKDEPSIQFIPLVAEIYKSIQKAYAELGLTNKKIIVNLLPFYPNSSFPNVGTDRQEGYRQYLDLWLKLSGAKDLQMDIYSLYTTGIYRQHIVNLQIAAEVAKKYDAKITVINSCWQRLKSNGEPDERFHTYQDMAWMNNITLAYGAGNFGWYTYHMDSTATVFDGASPITKAGLKTEIYDYVREINAKAQVLAPVILNFDYQKGGFYNNLTKSDEPANNNGNLYSKMQGYSSNYLNKGLTKVSSVQPNDSKYSWLVNELYDSNKGNYMYAVMNVIDSLNTTSNHSDEKSITLTFASEYNKAWVYRDGKFTVEPLTNSRLTLSNMKGGDCCYVIPFTI